MLEQAIDRLVALGQETQSVQIIDAKDPRKMLLRHGGELIEREVPAGLRKHQVDTLFDLMNCVQQPFAVKPVIWHNDLGVLLLLDDNDRRESITLKLELSPAFVALRTLEVRVADGTHPGFQPKELVNFFRRQLAGTIYDRAFVANLRKLKWKSAEEVRQQMGLGKESIGKDVEAELQTDIPMPEEITLEVPVYSTPYEEEMYAVRCLVDVDAFERRIFFMPEPGALGLALQAKQKDLREELEQNLKDTPIFQGTP